MRAISIDYQLYLHYCGEAKDVLEEIVDRSQ